MPLNTERASAPPATGKTHEQQPYKVWVDVVVCVALLVFGAPLCTMTSWLEFMDTAPIGKRREPDEAAFLASLALVFVPCALWLISHSVWRSAARATSANRQWTRGVILALFCAPSFFVWVGPMGGFGVPSPALFVLVFGHAPFKFWFGLLPILIACPIAIAAYGRWESRRALRKS